MPEKNFISSQSHLSKGLKNVTLSQRVFCPVWGISAYNVANEGVGLGVTCKWCPFFD